MFHKRWVLRQMTRSNRQAVLFVLCVVLSMVVLVALNGFSKSVDRMMRSDARQLNGGDVIIRSRLPLTDPLDRAVRELGGSGTAESVRTFEFYSMARRVDGDTSLLADLKVVEPGYPLYGRVVLGSGRPLARVLTPGTVVVEPPLLNRLGLTVGDRIRVGEATLTIGDTLVSEPDRPVDIFSFGPRVLVSSADLPGLDLMEKGSRIQYTVLLRLPDERRLQEVADRLKAAAAPEAEQVDTYRTARTRLKRFVDNLFFFLNLVGTFTLLLAGIGIYSSLGAYLKGQERTIAIFKALGAGSRWVAVQFLGVLFLLGLTGTVFGIAAGISLQWVLPLIFSGLLPESLTVTVSWWAVAQGLVLGLVIVVLFAFLPLHRLRNIKPAAILRKEAPVRFGNSPVTYGVALAILVFFAGLVVERMADVRTGGYFILGIAGLVGVTALVTGLVLALVKRATIGPLMARQALKGLFRPGNATWAVLISMTASLAFIFSIFLVEQNLGAAYVASYPAGAPNLFFLDIQPDQKERFRQALGLDAVFYPVIRARLAAVNDRSVDRDRERGRRGDNLARTFNLTYHGHLLEDETLIAGKQLFPEDFDGVPVSILDTVADIPSPKMTVGDRLTFRIQGVPLTATVTSIRRRVRESLSPFFYFVFPAGVLEMAPQTIFSAVRVDPDKIPGLQDRVVSALPNVTVIDVTRSAAQISEVLKRLVNIVRFFTLFSVAAGVLLLVSSIFATRFARTQEAVYYKVLGARGRFVSGVFGLENLFLGFISGCTALGLSQAGSWAVCTLLLDIAYRPHVIASGLLVGVSMLVALAAGLVPSISIIRQKPMGFLKAQTDE